MTRTRRHAFGLVPTRALALTGLATFRLVRNPKAKGEDAPPKLKQQRGTSILRHQFRRRRDYPRLHSPTLRPARNFKGVAPASGSRKSGTWPLERNDQAPAGHSVPAFIYIHKEALVSSQIEGTQISFADLLFLISAHRRESP
jgi:hypothetical protein